MDEQEKQPEPAADLREATMAFSLPEHMTDPGEPVAEEPVAEEPDSPPAPSRWRVCLPEQPALIVEARDRAGAIAAYDRACGILSTAHTHSVEPLE